VVYKKFLEKKRLIDGEMQRVKKTRIQVGGNRSETLEQYLKRPEITYAFIDQHSSSEQALTPEIKKQVEIQVKYEGYILRQMEMAEKLKKIEGKRIPDQFDYSAVNGLSREVRMKLEDIRPITLGQASRIPGITPAAISLLMIAVEKLKRTQTNKNFLSSS